MAPRQLPRNILILTAPIGRGHMSVARALAVDLRCAGAATVDVRTPFTHATGFCRLPRLYDVVTRHMPLVWGAYFYARRLKSVRNAVGRLIRSRIATEIESLKIDRYDAIILTSSVYCHLLADFAGRARTVVVMTDLTNGPREWFMPGADLYVAPSQAMREDAISQGVQPTQLVLRRLATRVDHDGSRRDLRRHDLDQLRVLVVGGSEGVGPLEGVVNGLVSTRHAISVTAVCGSNAGMRSRIGRMASDAVTAERFMPGLAARLSDFDLVVTKPGSVTLMEAIDARVPFWLMPGIPGIESGNKRWLSDQEGLPFVTDARSARDALFKLFENDLSLTDAGDDWRRRCLSVSSLLPASSLSLSDLVFG
jgi:UDP-N-acetylglucosamine:LPS N-acetylglucosamine transferase